MTLEGAQNPLKIGMLILFIMNKMSECVFFKGGGGGGGKSHVALLVGK